MRLAPMAYLGQSRRTVNTPNVALTLCDYVGGHVQPWHSHANPTFAFIIRGVYREIDRNGSSDVGSRSLLWHSTTADHSGVNCPDGCRVLNIELLPNWVSRYGKEANFAERNMIIGSGPAISACVQLLEEFRGNGPASELAIEGAALMLVAHTMRHTAREEKSSTTRWIRVACQVAEERFGDRLTVCKIAADLGVDPVTFSREFRKLIGVPFHQYVLDRRMGYVRSRLRKGDASIAEIAAEAGFTDQAHLCRVFKRESGLTPSAFRREATTDKRARGIFRSA
jgi:AraC-like DNA-binding protein